MGAEGANAHVIAPRRRNATHRHRTSREPARRHRDNPAQTGTIRHRACSHSQRAAPASRTSCTHGCAVDKLKNRHTLEPRKHLALPSEGLAPAPVSVEHPSPLPPLKLHWHRPASSGHLCHADRAVFAIRPSLHVLFWLRPQSNPLPPFPTPLFHSVVPVRGCWESKKGTGGRRSQRWRVRYFGRLWTASRTGRVPRARCDRP